MLLAHGSTLLSLLLCAPGNAGETVDGPRLEVLSGSVSVFAKEAWIRLTPGQALPDSRANSTLRLDWDARARLTLNGAGVELRGPLQVESMLQGEWTLRLSGNGQIQVDARSTEVRLELAATARLDMDCGVYWAEGVSSGGWRVGCDAGQPLVLRPPSGSGWPTAPRLVSGSSLRIVPTRMLPPITLGEARRPSASPWKSFSWPWVCSTTAGCAAP